MLLATLPPIKDSRELTEPGRKASIQALNREIRSMSYTRGNGGVVDVYAAMNSRAGLIGGDGAHPTAAGYQVMAEVFFQEIVNRFDITPRAQAFRMLQPGDFQ